MKVELCRLKSGLASDEGAGSGGVQYEGVGGSEDRVRISQPEDAERSSVDSAKPLGIEDVFTVDDAVELLGFGRFQLMLSFFTGLAWVSVC